MNVENAKSQMRKGMLEYCVLLLLRGKPFYANDIIRKLKESDLIVVEGTIYPLLTRLKKDGLLSYNWKESTQGPPRKYYELTSSGKDWLAGLDAAWKELANAVNLLQKEIVGDDEYSKLPDAKFAPDTDYMLQDVKVLPADGDSAEPSENEQ